MNLLLGFSGRIGRGGWWFGQFVMLVVSIACVGAIYGSHGRQGIEAARDGDFARLSASMVALLFAVTVLTTWIAFAVAIKRFHDRDKSGFWVLIIFVPVIGPLWQFIECGFLSGSDGSNGFGAPGGSDDSAGSADRLDLGSTYARATRAAPESVMAVSSAQSAPLRRQGTQAFGRRTR